MSIQSAWRELWRRDPVNKGSVPASTTSILDPSTSQIAAMMQTAPKALDIPDRWSSEIWGPGRPIEPVITSLPDKQGLTEPRSFQYIPSVNATITPRVGYNLLSFDKLTYYTTVVPECALARRIIIEEMKNFVPQIMGPDGMIVQKARARREFGPDGSLTKVTFSGDNEVEGIPELAWMTTRPDRFASWPMWLGRFLWNVIVYDAGNFYRLRDKQNKIIGLRVVDGATLFCFIDQRGEQPQPPAPAFSQIIFGTPYAWMSTYQMWYRPRQLRSNAPYGIAPVEDCQRAADLLDQIWQYTTAEYTEGTMPEAYLELPAGWTPEQCLAWEQKENRRMGGNAVERRRVRTVPQGTKFLETKTAPWPKEAYEVARDQVLLNHGVHPSEVGKLQGTGLSGAKGGMEKGEDSHARMGIGPIRAYIEAAMNDILLELGYTGYTFELGAGQPGIDPQKEETKWTTRWTSKGITRDNYLEGIGMQPVGGDAGAAYWTQTGSAEGGDPAPAPVPAGLAGAVRPASPPAQADEETTEAGADLEAVPEQGQEKGGELADAKKLAKHCGVCPEDDAYFGAQVLRAETVLMGVGANGAEIVAIQPKGGDPIPALWKPGGSERDDLVEFVGGAMYLREEAAYLLDRALQFYLVPLAYVTTVDDEPGAVVYYSLGNGERIDAAAYKPYWLELAAVLDYIAGQRDRRMHNWLTHPDDRERPLLIDNGMSFPTRPMMVNSAFCNAWGVAQVNIQTLQKVRQCQGDVVWKDIADLVGPDATQCALDRLAKLLETGRLV